MILKTPIRIYFKIRLKSSKTPHGMNHEVL